MNAARPASMERLAAAARLAAYSVCLLVTAYGHRADRAYLLFAAGAILYSVITSLPAVTDRRGSSTAIVALDVLMISVIVWSTGQMRSEYFLLYYVPLSVACVRLRFREAVTSAVLTGVCYSFVGLLGRFDDVTFMTTGDLQMVTVGVSSLVFATVLGTIMRGHTANQRVTDALQGAIERLSAVYDVARASSAGEDLQNILDDVATQATHLVDGEAGTLALLDPESGELRSRASCCVVTDVTSCEPQFAEAAARQALQTGTAAVSYADGQTRAGAVISVPLVAAGSSLGVLQVHLGAGRSLRPRQIEALCALCAEASIAIETARLRAERDRLAVTDRLTGILNRGEWEKRLADEVARCSRYHHPLSVLLLDVDNFKEINDQCGHAEGDRILRGLATVFQTCIRTTDTAARYGGDEFALLLPETDLDGAAVVADRIRDEFSRLFPCTDAEGNGQPATVSAGVVAAPAGNASAERLMEQADQALYRAKREGRDRVCAELVEPDLAAPTSETAVL
jgi:diguanylate cyclase (GGDEF)-like protein